MTGALAASASVSSSILWNINVSLILYMKLNTKVV